MEAFTQFLMPVITSVIVTLSTLYVTSKMTKRQMHLRFVEKVVDRRITLYPELWRITSAIHAKTWKVEAESFAKEWASRYQEDLWGWYYQQGNGVFMNENSKEAFLALYRYVLGFEKHKDYNRLRTLVNNLRIELRADLMIKSRKEEATEIG